MTVRELKELLAQVGDDGLEIIARLELEGEPWVFRVAGMTEERTRDRHYAAIDCDQESD